MKDFSELNSRRKKSANLVIIGAIGLIIGIVFTFLVEEYGFLAFPFIIVGIILISVGGGQFQKLKTLFKTEYLNKALKEVFQDVVYDPFKGLPPERVYRDGILKKADRFHSEDLIQGSFSNVKFVTCDLKLEERHVRQTKNGTQVYYVTYFLGRFFEFEFPKNFPGKIVLTEGSLLTWFTNLKKVELESVEFNRRFRTYTSDEHSAFYVLTPHLMESLLELERQNPGTIVCAFIDNRLTIAINNNRDTFELNLFQEINDSALQAMKKEMNVISKIIEELRLNRKIYNN